ncbi:MAG: MAPEG family protein [Burkholderiales bacterium]|nr:MAPEG family protein [Burkholderiales bacterium]
MSKELYWLALTLAASALLMFPYVLNRIAVRGMAGTLANPGPGDKPLAAWAQRCQRAHANAIENLVVFAPAALAVHVLAKGDPMTATACAVYFFARLVHYLAYTFGVPGVRTLAFFAGWGSTLVLIARVLGWL